MAEIVEAPFRAPWWLRSPHLQTLWGPLWRRADDIAAITDARVGGGARSQGREGFSSHENLSNR